jgi:predicted MPP superfamily phosphohydrolase
MVLPALGLGAAVGGALLAYGVAEARWYRLRHRVLDGVLRRPGASMRVLHVSDVHLARGQDHRVRFLRSLAELEPDLTVVTGDLLGDVGVEEAAADAVGALTGPGRPGLFVLGSNDLYGPIWKSPTRYLTGRRIAVEGTPLATERLLGLLEERGYTTVRNTATAVETRAGTVAVGGIDDPHLEDTVIPAPDVLAPAASGESDAALHLGLVHAPYVAALDALSDAGHDLLLAGHTHGGQVRLPGVGALTANCDLPLSQARGSSRWRDRWLHVSPGLGHSKYTPVRFACRPEATLLELRG